MSNEILSLKHPVGRILSVVGPLLYLGLTIFATTMVGWAHPVAIGVFFGMLFGPLVVILLLNWGIGVVTWMATGDPYWPLVDDHRWYGIARNW